MSSPLSVSLPTIVHITVRRTDPNTTKVGLALTQCPGGKNGATMVRVDRISPTSPFANSKLQVGMVLLSIQGQTNIDSNKRAISIFSLAGNTISVVATQPSSQPNNDNYTNLVVCNPSLDGITLQQRNHHQSSSHHHHKSLGIRFAQVCGGVLVRVSFVAEHSPFNRPPLANWGGGVKVGDIVLSINGNPVSHPDHALKLLYHDAQQQQQQPVVVLQVFRTYEYLVDNVLSPAWNVSFGGGDNTPARNNKIKLTMKDILAKPNTDEHGNPNYPWNRLCVHHQYTIPQKSNSNTINPNNTNHQFQIHEEDLAVSHTEPYRFMNFNPHEASAAKIYMGGKFKKFVKELERRNQETRQFVHAMQQLVWESYESSYLGMTEHSISVDTSGLSGNTGPENGGAVPNTVENGRNDDIWA